MPTWSQRLIRAPRKWLATTLDADQSELLRLHLRHWRTSLAGAAAATVAVALLLGGVQEPVPRLLLWAACACAIYAVQALLCLRLGRRPPEHPPSPRWLRLLWMTGAATGIAWGGLPWWLPGDQTAVQTIAATVSCLVLIGAAGATSHAEMLVAMLTPAFLLLSTAMVWHARLPIAGGAMLAMAPLLMRHVLVLQQATVDTIRHRRRAERLAAESRFEEARLRAVEREQALLAERQRLLRDMHDGLGSSLISALRIVEQGRVTPAETADLLRDCIDDMRLAIDTLGDGEPDLAELLRHLRQRLGRRIEAAGLALDWDIGALPPMPGVGAPETLQLLRILQELLSNVLRHAGARSIRLRARAEGPATLRIDVEDDGVGFDTRQVAHGRGLRHVRQRVAQLRGELEVDSRPGGGTRVRLRLPGEAAGSAGAPEA